jgi:RNA polymerase sigma-70 factor, ECF subfamily
MAPALALPAPRPMRLTAPGRAAAPVRRLDTARLGDHLDVLYRVAMVLTRSPHEAEDLVQETYAKILARPRFLRNDDDLGYLIRALRNVHNTRIRTSLRRPRTTRLEEGWEAPDTRTTGAPEEQAASREVLDAISELAEPFRDAVLAVDVAGLSYGEAARLLGVKEATITSRLHRARARVAAQLT